MRDFDMGDFQGVVTLGMARAPKCIFPYRGAWFSKGVPPHVHAHGCTWPRRCPRRPKRARKQSSAKRKGQTLGKIDPKTVRLGKLSGCSQALGKTKRIRPSVGQKWPENSPAVQKGARKESSVGNFRIFFWIFEFFLNFWRLFGFLDFFWIFEFFEFLTTQQYT